MRSIVLTLALLAGALAWAGGPRSLALGGVTLPGAEAAGRNPAYAARELAGPFGASLALPVGALNALVQPRLDPTSDSFDLLTVLEQASHLGTFVLAPATSPDEVTFRVAAGPTLTIETVGGSTLALERDARLAVGYEVDLPLALPLGPVVVGVRPFGRLSARVEGDEAFEQLFGQGASAATLEGGGEAEAGVALDVAFATRLPVPQSAFPGRLYVGARGAPFVGLARAEATATATVAAVENASGETEATYSYAGETFLASVAEGQLGYGIEADVGAAAAVPVDGGEAHVGLSLRGLGVETWSGTTQTFAGASDGSSSTGPATPATRTLFAEDLSVFANAAYRADRASLPMVLSALQVGADVEVGGTGTRLHAGVEAGFGLGPATLWARGGAGLDDGLVAGVGTGVSMVGVGLDLALHTFRSPLTTHQAFGVAAGLRFGF